MGDYGHLGRFSGTHYLSTVSAELEGEFQGFSGKKNKPLKGVYILQDALPILTLSWRFLFRTLNPSHRCACQEFVMVLVASCGKVN